MSPLIEYNSKNIHLKLNRNIYFKKITSLSYKLSKLKVFDRLYSDVYTNYTQLLFFYKNYSNRIRWSNTQLHQPKYNILNNYINYILIRRNQY